MLPTRNVEIFRKYRKIHEKHKKKDRTFLNVHTQKFETYIDSGEVLPTHSHDEVLYGGRVLYVQHAQKEG